MEIAFKMEKRWEERGTTEILGVFEGDIRSFGGGLRVLQLTWTWRKICLLDSPVMVQIQTEGHERFMEWNQRSVLLWCYWAILILSVSFISGWWSKHFKSALEHIPKFSSDPAESWEFTYLKKPSTVSANHLPFGASDPAAGHHDILGMLRPGPHKSVMDYHPRMDT